jgi:hypothetical protein
MRKHFNTQTESVRNIIKKLLKEQEEPSHAEKSIRYLTNKVFTVNDDHYGKFSYRLPEIYLREVDNEICMLTYYEVVEGNVGSYYEKKWSEEHTKEFMSRYLRLDVNLWVLPNKERFDAMKLLLEKGSFTAKISLEDLPSFIETGRDWSDDILSMYFTDDVDYYSSDYSQWEYYVGHLNEDNQAKVRQHIQYILSQLDDEDFEEEGYESMEEVLGLSNEDILSHFKDHFDELTTLMDSIIEDGDRDDQADYIRKHVISALENYGNVTWDWDTEEFTIEGNFYNIDGITLEDIWKGMEHCEDDASCMLRELVSDGYSVEKARFGADSRHTGSCSWDYFNEGMADRVGELEGVK